MPQLTACSWFLLSCLLALPLLHLPTRMQFFCVFYLFVFCFAFRSSLWNAFEAAVWKSFLQAGAGSLIQTLILNCGRVVCLWVSVWTVVMLHVSGSQFGLWSCCMSLGLYPAKLGGSQGSYFMSWWCRQNYSYHMWNTMNVHSVNISCWHCMNICVSVN